MLLLTGASDLLRVSSSVAVATIDVHASWVDMVIGATTGVGGLVIGDIPPGQHKAVWVRRTVNAAAAAFADSFTLRVQGDTNP